MATRKGRALSRATTQVSFPPRFAEGKRVEQKLPLNPFAAGIFCGCMMAQIEILL
jgi:hypothetical protein